MLSPQRHHRVVTQHLGFEKVHRELWAGDVGHCHVEWADLRTHHSVGQGEKRDGSPRAEFDDGGRSECLIRVFQVAGAPLDEAVPGGRVLLIYRQLDAPHGYLVAQLAHLIGVSSGHRVHRPELGVGWVEVPVVDQKFAYRAGGDSEHDIVDRTSEGVLDLLDLIQVHVGPIESSVRSNVGVERGSA